MGGPQGAGKICIDSPAHAAVLTCYHAGQNCFRQAEARRVRHVARRSATAPGQK